MQISKRNNTAFKVLYLLMLLSKSPKTIDNLIFEMSVFEDDIMCTKGVVLKYINTLRVAGFDILKEKEKNDFVYKISNSPFKIDFEEIDIKTINILRQHIEGYFSDSHKNAYEDFLEIIKPYIEASKIELLKSLKNKDLSSGHSCLDDKQKVMINSFSKLSKENHRVEVYYKYKENELIEKILLEPKGVHYLSNIIYFAGYSPLLNSTRLIPFKNVLKLEVLPTRSKFKLMRKDIVFKLIGRVARGYNLRSNEKLLEKEDSFVIISNNYEDKELLFKRLLRYGAYCEILQPEYIRKDFSKMLKEVLEIYLK